MLEVLDTAGQGEWHSCLSPSSATYRIAYASLTRHDPSQRNILRFETSGSEKAKDSYLFTRFQQEQHLKGLSDSEVKFREYSLSTSPARIPHRVKFLTSDRLLFLHRRVKDQEPHTVPIMLVGNKCDKVSEREVSREEGQALANRLGCKFVESSAKTCVNVERAYYTVVRMIREQREGTSGGKERKKKSRCNIL